MYNLPTVSTYESIQSQRNHQHSIKTPHPAVCQDNNMSEMRRDTRLTMKIIKNV